ncbi:sugar-binding transcriptional regulator [Aestuariibacter sp. A3R04]|uniref:sugar-binding transcriptional regulator n=1 Tax=Aestuariibacter sp. A3R04 TaxID=2841571 RepID=UPI001C084435|nr:sugar-binding transcriptional regulator [Aestuariibacter sp. A3R04]MBU3021689.1 sugar-binding transcriptional regulator [Aestuariibacter sp. A3R04]
MSKKLQTEKNRIDEAARAGWLYYVAGKTQDEIAKMLNTSRQSAQRMVALAMSEGLIKVRLEHPIARCMELAERIKHRFGLRYCEVVPAVDEDPNSTLGLGEAGAAAIERELKSETSKTIAFGTGRVLRHCANELALMQCPQHKIVSLVGNIDSDGAATRYDVAVHIADRIKGQHYPMPLPVIAASEKEKNQLQQQSHVKRIQQLAQRADALFVGIGNLGLSSPLHVDGFIDDDNMDTLAQGGAAGEIISWVYDINGNILDCDVNRRVTSSVLTPSPDKPVVGIASGLNKRNAIVGALRSTLINGLITNETTAMAVLSETSPAGNR